MQAVEQRHQSYKGEFRYKGDDVVLREMHLRVQSDDKGIHRPCNQEYMDGETDNVTQAIPNCYGVLDAFDDGKTRPQRGRCDADRKKDTAKPNYGSDEVNPPYYEFYECAHKSV